jgi:hypothetical protein
MAKKKMTTKKTVKKSAPKAKLNKTQVIEKALAASPGKGPKEISEALTAKGVDVSPAYVSTIKTNLKAKTATPAPVAPTPAAPTPAAPIAATPKKKATKKKKIAKKKAAKKRAPKAAPATDITFEQLCMAKAMAKQLGGAEKAKEALAALAQLVD